MRLTRLYIDQPLASGSTFALETDRTHYVRNVLRLKSGAHIALFNGVDDADYQSILHFNGRNIEVEIISAHASKTDSALDSEVILGVSRSDRIDFSIQKCTELGVNRIAIFNARHSQNPIKSAQQKKRMTHWQAIAIKACEQCGRHRIPQIHFYSGIEAMLENARQTGTKLILDFNGLALPELLSRQSSNGQLSLLTGPEGGLTSEEISLATDQQFLLAYMGPRVLRTETAAIAGLAIIQSLWGDMTG